MMEGAGGGLSPKVFFYESGGSSKNYLPITSDFQPDFICVYDKTRFSASNYGGNSNIPFVLFDSTCGSYASQLTANNAGQMKRNTCTFTDGTLKTAISYRTFWVERTYCVFGASLSDVPENVFVENVEVETAGSRLVSSCPFTPDLIIAYDMTYLLEGVVTRSKTFFRCYDNAALGQYDGHTQSNSDAIFIGSGTISAAYSPSNIPMSTIAGHNYRVICLRGNE